jgi:hypothetical protein
VHIPLICGAAITIVYREPSRWIDPVTATPSGTLQMKRYIDNFLQHPRSRFESSLAARQYPIPRSIAASANLHPEDGYDWLRQIKSAQASRQAGR